MKLHSAKQFGRQKGITLVEVSIGLAIAAVVAGTAFAGFQANARRTEMQSNAKLLAEMVADTKSLFGPSNHYGELTTAAAIAARIIPDTYAVSTTAARNSYGGDIAVTALTAGNNDNAMVKFGSVPAKQCADLTLSLDRAASGIMVLAAGAATPTDFTTAATELVKANASGEVINVANLTAACSNTNNDLYLVFGRG